MALKAPVTGWTRFLAAQEWIDRNYPSGAAPAAATAAAEAPRDSKLDRDDPLFREFLEWRASRLKANR